MIAKSRASRRRMLPISCLLAALSVTLLGCSQATQRPTSLSAPAVSLPLDSSLSTGTSTWAVLPMGEIGSLANTFWQVVVLRSGQSRWSLATPPGVADNGGLVVADEGGSRSALEVGFLTSELLGFSPVALTTDAGSKWSPGTLPVALTPGPGTLSVSSTGPATALTGPNGKSVMSSSNGLSGWRSVTTLARLASTAGSSCGVQSLTATGDSEIGAACSRPGRVGLFGQTGGVWKAIGPKLMGSLAHSRSEVAEIGGSNVLVLATSKSLTALVMLRRVAGRWTQSAPLTIAAGTRIQAIGASGGGGTYALLAKGPTSRPTDERLEVLGPESTTWTLRARPPAGTDTVAFAKAGLFSFAAHQSKLDISELALGRFVEVQVMRVPIQYGSSS